MRIISLSLLIAFCLQATAEETRNQRTTPWTTSRVQGSPNPPLPYTTQRVFTKVILDRPTNISWLPSAQKWIANHAGNKIVTFDNETEDATAEPLLNLRDLMKEQVQTGYATMFHHDLANEPWCFITLTKKRKLDDGHCLVRVRVIDPTIPTFDMGSVTEMLHWKSNGHVGSSMAFGSDGMLYLSVGDGQPPYPPDGDGVGQDLSDLRSSILRLDVSQPTPKRPYRIPKDNPFIGVQNAREEIWAYGFRNPWKISFAPGTRDLLVADVGWEMREMIHLVRSGQNHGWSIMEGSQQVKPDQQPKVPITRPLFEHTHLDSRSITGGYVWQSDRIPDLQGVYIYGDWMTGKVWGLRYEGDRVTWQKELADTTHRIICFMQDPMGEVFIVAYDGSIHRLSLNSQNNQTASFPTKLSETGIFENTSKLQPAEGVIEYDINAHHWADGTHSRQWIALPNHTQVTLFEESDWKTGESEGRFVFPTDSVAVKTVSYFTNAQDTDSEKHIETQLLHKNGEEWAAYNYIWNEEQTDAFLQEDRASDRKLIIKDLTAPNGQRVQTWHHSSRSECLLCHVWSSGTVQGFWPPQLSLQQEKKNQIDSLSDLGLFAEPVPKRPALVAADDKNESLENRARSYLALNCSTCHRKLGGGTATFTFDPTVPLDDSQYIDAVPSQGSFGIKNARIIAPGEPSRSVILYRTLKSGRGHMPQFGSNVIDAEGVRLLHDWIESMESASPTEPGPKPPLRLSKFNGMKDHEIESALSTIEGAMILSIACSGEINNPALQRAIVKRGASHTNATTRDLFEHFLPENERTPRLGTNIDENAILAMKGSTQAGKTLFETGDGITCRNCHRLNQVGQNIGPTLESIGTQQTPAELLGSILRPSENVAAAYQTKQIVLSDGRILSGVILDDNTDLLVLADSGGKQYSLAKDEIESMRTSPRSMMPENLLSGMTPSQAADLLAYLESQRKSGPLQHRVGTIYRASGPIQVDGKRDEVDWENAPTFGDFTFTWWKEGDPEKQPTEAKLLWDNDFLYLSYHCSDKDIRATRTGRDSKVYRDDCVEVFASPEFLSPENYFNLEMNALGQQLDQYRPDGTMKEQWDPEGIKIAVLIDGTLNDPTDVDRGWTLEVAIPFKLFENVLPQGHPNPGDRWRLNLSRLEDEMRSKSQWSQGDRNFPRFHHPEYFGTVEFHPDAPQVMTDEE